MAQIHALFGMSICLSLRVQSPVKVSLFSIHPEFKEIETDSKDENATIKATRNS